MADATYDAVIIGGGTKALATAIYLAKYGGMEVAIFERRHEMGGGLASSEAPAPGFIGDSHATNITLWYYLPVKEDFPDFEEKGGKIVQSRVPMGVITREDQKCCLVYNVVDDPSQEKSAREITRFAGEKDAETYLKLWEYAHKQGSSFDEALNETIFSLPPPPGQLTAYDRWIIDYLKQPDCPIDEEFFILSPLKAGLQLFESPGLILMWLRRCLAASVQPTCPSGGMAFLGTGVLSSPNIGFILGGTHSVAHAYIRIFLENGGKFFTHSHVDKIIIENGKAKGIRLNDGTEVEARKLVLSTLSPHQLCFQLIGREHLSQRILKKVANLEGGWNAITWYTWALREPPGFRAAEFNPDVNEGQNIVLGSNDLDVWVREAHLRGLGKNPPIENMLLSHLYTKDVDKTRSPDGRQTLLTEQFVAPANALSEQEWLQFKKTHAEDVVREFQQFAPNMTWDNVIGYDPITPFDTAARLNNMAPWGDWSIYNCECYRPGSMWPILEFARHRVPGIMNLYVTGAPWSIGSGSCDVGYRAYKAMAEDLGLRKPWEEKGRPY